MSPATNDDTENGDISFDPFHIHDGGEDSSAPSPPDFHSGGKSDKRSQRPGPENVGSTVPRARRPGPEYDSRVVRPIASGVGRPSEDKGAPVRPTKRPSAEEESATPSRRRASRGNEGLRHPRRPGAEEDSPPVRPGPNGAERTNGNADDWEHNRPRRLSGGPEIDEDVAALLSTASLAPPVRNTSSRGYSPISGKHSDRSTKSSDHSSALYHIPEHHDIEISIGSEQYFPEHHGIEVSLTEPPLRVQRKTSTRRQILREQSSRDTSSTLSTPSPISKKKSFRPQSSRSVATSTSSQSRLLPGGVSIYQGEKAFRVSTVRTSNAPKMISSDSSTVSFTPRKLVDIENGTSMVVTKEEFLDSKRYQPMDESGALAMQKVAPLARPDYYIQSVTSLEDKMQRGDVRDFRVNGEVGIVGGMWRGTLRRLMVNSNDSINSLQLSRGLQLFLPFLTSYESYVLAQVIQALDQERKKDLQYTLKVAFQDRNVSRILVQTVGPRFDFVWHLSTQITHNRVFDAWGRVPLLGITSFPATENFPSTRDHALASIFRNVLGQGNWITRVITGREGLITDDPQATAQNLAAESNGFELANRNQYGTYIGRRKTNEFRFAHRLPTDESIVRTFVAQPGPTMVNNGVVHVLRQLAKHWHNILWQPSGNFSHQRQEQLNPFETLRFHMPIVLLTLSSLRGRNRWDSKVLGPFVKRLQELKPNLKVEPAVHLISELKDTIVTNVSGGVAIIVDPFVAWLDAMKMSCVMLEEEAKKVYDKVTSVEIGIRLGHDLITQIDWKIPPGSELKKAILHHIHGEPTGDISEKSIHTAMSLITPRDKRTLVELVQNGLSSSRPAQLLLGRAKTLLERELRRDTANQTIQMLSKGDEVSEPNRDEWYWLEFENGSASGVYIYDAKVTGGDLHRFVHVDTKFEVFVPLSAVVMRAYVPVAEAISRAQRAFMNIELDHGEKFTLDAFMDFTFLRTALRRLIVISQVTCDELDNARLNMLAEIQRSSQAQVSVHDLQPGQSYYLYDSTQREYVPFVYEKKLAITDPEWKRLARTKIVKVPPQSSIVVGGGPTGLMTVIHCTEAVLMSGGEMKLYEARDAFAKGGATFERAQIVRLDARWIAMLRYHLGTGFEDVYIPASGETDAQLGNTLPMQGFVEITIKDLENMLHVEVSKMWSKGLLSVYSDSKSTFDPKTNSLAKLGAHLKLNDAILRRVNQDGRRVNSYHSWKVVEFDHTNSLGTEDLTLGEGYGIYVREANAILPYMLTGIDLQTQIYTFVALQDGQSDIQANATSMPYVYPKGIEKHAEVRKLVLESVKKGSNGGYSREIMFMKDIKDKKFTLDVGHTHVVEAIGKPHGSKVHFCVTTQEPYGVCCIQGLKISMGMHNFGEKRWDAGLVDDIRSQTDQNTRIIGDFTKMVRSAPVTQKMYEYMSDERDKNWCIHFETLAIDAGFPELNDLDPVVPKIRDACEALSKAGPTFRRQTLQTRFFETGDNYYLGMEFMREYDKWKKELATELVVPLLLKAKDDEKKNSVDKLKGTFMHHIDRLWYDAVLEVIRTGDVYNPGARSRVPRLYLIDSYVDEELGKLPVGESFRLSDNQKEKYEIVIKERSQVIVRCVEGYISKMPKSTLVRRESNLTRGPDGNAESKVALATFPVGHYVNFRTCRLNSSEKGYIFAFIGDEQATPHFMRYSGLTGACINAMLFNNFVKEAMDGVPFLDRLNRYVSATNWSNGEVVQRGTGNNYGEDGFLRPGFPYDHGMDYLRSKVIECLESGQDLGSVITRDWKVKFAASLVPRGMEMNDYFITALHEQLHQSVFNTFIQGIKEDEITSSDTLESVLEARRDDLVGQRLMKHSADSYWDEFLAELDVDFETKEKLVGPHVFLAKQVENICEQVIDTAVKSYLYNERISSELFNQPKPVDSILDDFAVEAQNFANSLTQSAAFAAGALAFMLVDARATDIVSAILAGVNILLAFGTMADSARYKIRNEEARIIFADEKELDVLKGVFGLMDRHQQGSIPTNENPFVIDLKQQVSIFLKNVEYYDCDEPKEFKACYQVLLDNINDPNVVRNFLNLLATKFISDDFHVNSYLQEHLVNIYKSVEGWSQLLANPVGQSNPQAMELFNSLTRFSDNLEDTLQRGPTRFGFLKKRRFAHWDVTVALSYLCSSLFCVSRTGCTLPLAPTSIRTLAIVKQAQHTRASDSNSQQLRLGREIRDLEGLYWATRESEVSSLIFVTGFLVFIASILFTIARIFRIESLLNVAFWASLASALGAILAAFHLWRKFWILVKLASTLGTKAKTALLSDDRENIRKVRRVTWTQIALTATRFLTAITAAVALPWSIAENAFGGRINTPATAPFWLAFASIIAAIASTIFFFVVEYNVRYRLSPKLGEFVCESFRDEIEEIKTEMTRPLNDIDTKQVQERETWEYVAREFVHRYRFDTVFAADRFGNIWQYLQGGMDPLE